MSDSLVQSVAQILVDLDPLRLYFPQYENRDEYDAEAAQIASRLPACTSLESSASTSCTASSSTTSERTLPASVKSTRQSPQRFGRRNPPVKSRMRTASPGTSHA